ncbi:MAG: molybdenum cofactor guanylyltransferase [Acidobacteria bacterium]|nr:molybdenum cofactor guanylyltransferase [Acidobacteriota bacterium]
MPDHSETIIHAFIQAGGRSSRMGTDKAWLEINGRPMIEHVLAAAEPAAASLSIVINPANPNAERYRELAAKWDARLLYDLHDHKGPLGGIHTALKTCAENESALILACDMPFITAEFLNFLCQKHMSGNASVTVPIDQEGRFQPLAAIYSRACLLAIEEKLATDRLKVDQLFEQVLTQLISFDKMVTLQGSEITLSNLNSPEDYQATKS